MLRRQIYDRFKEQILSGKLRAGEALPSTRALSQTMGISRSTVVEAYDMLISEGFLTSSQGAPTRVAEGLVMESPTIAPMFACNVQKPILRADFRTGRPDLREFPFQTWKQCLFRGAASIPTRQYGYADCQGLPELRTEISAWLMRSRGFLVDPADLFITAGATHALHLLASLLCGKGKKVLVEDPCHSGMRRALQDQGCEAVPIPVDDRGMQTDRIADGADACAVYVTPSHQFPLGGILPAARRAALIRFARAHDLYIIEDDYDSEFRYVGAPIAPLYTMDAQRVLYVGTFSKTVFPALRIGYAVLPKQLQAAWREQRMVMDVQNPPFEQAALAEFLKTRKLDRHIYNMRKLYGKRRQALLAALEDSFGDGLRPRGDAAGLHVAIDFPDKRFDEIFTRRCDAAGILVTPLESHCIRKGGYENTLVLGYGHLDHEGIRAGVGLLKETMDYGS